MDHYWSGLEFIHAHSHWGMHENSTWSIIVLFYELHNHNNVYILISQTSSKDVQYALAQGYQ